MNKKEFIKKVDSFLEKQGEYFKKEVTYNWDEFYYGFGTILISIILLMGAISNFIIKDYFISSLCLFGIIGFNIFSFIINLMFIREVKWRKI